MAFDPPYNKTTSFEGTIAQTNVPQLIGQIGAGYHGFLVMNLSLGSHNMAISWHHQSFAIGDPGTYTLLPAGSFTSPVQFCPIGDYYIVGTAGDSYSMDIY